MNCENILERKDSVYHRALCSHVTHQAQDILIWYSQEAAHFENAKNGPGNNDRNFFDLSPSGPIFPELGPVLTNAQIAAGYALTLRLRYATYFYARAYACSIDLVANANRYGTFRRVV
jgi:hypothetical protein